MARRLQSSVDIMKNQNDQKRDPKAPQMDDERTKQSNTRQKDGQTADDQGRDETPARDSHGRFTSGD